MLWRKSWIDTRWRFLSGLALLLLAACSIVMSFTAVQQLAASLPAGAGVASGSLQQEIEEQLALARTFRGYVWSEWFSGNFPLLLTFVAALLGSGNPLTQSGSGALFSLALPVSRSRWIGTRAAIGLAELLVLAFVTSAAVAVLAPVVGEQFAVADALVYGASAFVVASLFFALAAFLSTIFNDVWRPLLSACVVALAIAAVGSQVSETHGLFQAMAGRSYFYSGTIAWPELALSAVGVVALVYAAAANIARRDF